MANKPKPKFKRIVLHWTGIVAVLTAVGLTLKPELSDAIVSCALGVFGLIQVIVNDRAGRDE